MRRAPILLSLIIGWCVADLAAAQNGAEPVAAGGPVAAAESKTAPAVALIERGSKTDWRYLDTGAELPPTWTSGDFDDKPWQVGRAPLGYGRPDVSTKISFGGNPAAKHLAAYFRRSFDFAEGSAPIVQLEVQMRIDDGIVAYLNGQELVRQNMPVGPATASTRAVRRIEGTEEAVVIRQVVPATALRSGRNVLAAEVHQFNAGSSDL